MSERFNRYALAASQFVGSTPAFIGACILVILWMISGPALHYSVTWQLIINTDTSIVTFLIVFLIQHGQNRDTRSIRLKLDELLRVIEGARPSLIDLDRLSDEEITRLEQQFKEWRRRLSETRMLVRRRAGGCRSAGARPGARDQRELPGVFVRVHAASDPPILAVISEAAQERRAELLRLVIG